MRGLSVLLLTIASVASVADAAVDVLHVDKHPHPALTPAQVVAIQIEALGSNDARDQGVEVAFRFASPSNRSQTGPLPRFAQMIRQGVYALMLDHTAADYGEAETAGDRARLRVTLARPSQTATYLFYLSRQKDAPYENCWMTDGVLVVKSEKLQV